MMWPLKPKPATELPAYVPLTEQKRIAIEFEARIERGFFSCNGGMVGGGFEVVANILADQEIRLRALEAEKAQKLT